MCIWSDSYGFAFALLLLVIFARSTGVYHLSICNLSRVTYGTAVYSYVLFERTNGIQYERVVYYRGSDKTKSH